jgi:hypothetical protein
MRKFRNKWNQLTVDVETLMKNEHNKIVAEIGWTLGNILDRGDKPLSRRFLVAETMFDSSMWLHSQKLCKVHETLKDTPEGERTTYKVDSRYKEYQQEMKALNRIGKLGEVVKSWDRILDILAEDLGMADCVASYNWNFDYTAIQTTTKRFYHHNFVELDRLPHLCIMDCFANKVINRDYFSFLDDLDKEEQEYFKSKSGLNWGYTAEIMSRYVSQDIGYTELHKALPDSMIEDTLSRYFIENYKKDYFYSFLGNPKFVSWTNIKKRLTASAKMKQREMKL